MILEINKALHSLLEESTVPMYPSVNNASGNYPFGTYTVFPLYTQNYAQDLADVDVQVSVFAKASGLEGLNIANEEITSLLQDKVLSTSEIASSPLKVRSQRTVWYQDDRVVGLITTYRCRAWQTS